MVAQLVPAGSDISEISQRSISGDAGGCETSVPEDAESATAPSQNTECEDLELTTSRLLVFASRHKGEGHFLL